nr:vexin isoform X2 [Equus asinus]
MHQIYSCSDENIEVFTTVIPSKVSSPARRRVKSSQHLLTKNVVIESDLHTPRALELLPHRSDRRDAEGRRSGRLQTARPPGAQPAKTPARPVGISEPKSANLCGSRAYGKSLLVARPWLLLSPARSSALRQTEEDSSGGPDLSESPHRPGGGSHRPREWSCSDKRIQTSQEDD